MHQIIIVERFLPSSFYWPNLLRKNRIIGLSIEQILNTYQGFEGELIDMFSINENKNDLNKTIDKSLEIKNSNNYLLLHVLSEFTVLPPSLLEKTFFVGYDIGVCEEDKTIYSSIFNEIIFGNLNQLIEYKNLLNEYFLFQDINIAKQYLELHDFLSISGKDVEDYEEMRIYEIWKHKCGV